MDTPSGCQGRTIISQLAALPASGVEGWSTAGDTRQVNGLEGAARWQGCHSEWSEAESRNLPRRQVTPCKWAVETAPGGLKPGVDLRRRDDLRRRIASTQVDAQPEALPGATLVASLAYGQSLSTMDNLSARPADRSGTWGHRAQPGQVQTYLPPRQCQHSGNPGATGHCPCR
jgi:hypothetical protein